MVRLHHNVFLTWQMGLHRDGSKWGLSPEVVEQRRLVPTAMSLLLDNKLTIVVYSGSVMLKTSFKLIARPDRKSTML